MASDAQLLHRRKVDELVRSLKGTLRAEELAEIHQMAIDGEPAEGIRALAWIIEGGEKKVPLAVRLRICDLSRELVDIRDMPESFRALLLSDQEPQNPI